MPLIAKQDSGRKYRFTELLCFYSSRDAVKMPSNVQSVKLNICASSGALSLGCSLVALDERNMFEIRYECVACVSWYHSSEVDYNINIPCELLISVLDMVVQTIISVTTK